MGDAIDIELDIWEKRTDEVNNVLTYTFAICDFILLIASVIVFIKVCCTFKRREFFLLAIPILFLLRGVLSIPVNYEFLIGNDELNWIGIVISVSYIYRIGHWLFSAQYLQTSIIFPKLFIAA